ncbi:MAG: pyridoxamine 5'-phosphate oxidase family protein [Ignavibacteriaceae bacterium]
MQKNIKQIRDLHIIEKELNACPAGILALYIDDDKIVQVATTFLYQDKNIYFFLDDTSELYQSIHFNATTSFAIVKNDKIKKNQKNEHAYKSLSITIAGHIKRIDEQKIIDEIKQQYLNKYAGENENTNIEAVTGNIVMIDTQEIQAVEESGG